MTEEKTHRGEEVEDDGLGRGWEKDYGYWKIELKKERREREKKKNKTEDRLAPVIHHAALVLI